MKHYQFALFLVLLVLALAVSAKNHDDDYYYRNGAYAPGMPGGWVDEYGRWHSGATAQTIVTSVLAIPAALAVGLMAFRRGKNEVPTYCGILSTTEELALKLLEEKKKT
ncbi:unnamed protein product [Umbelopsis vinacea]